MWVIHRNWVRAWHKIRLRSISRNVCQKIPSGWLKSFLNSHFMSCPHPTPAYDSHWQFPRQVSLVFSYLFIPCESLFIFCSCCKTLSCHVLYVVSSNFYSCWRQTRGQPSISISICTRYSEFKKIKIWIFMIRTCRVKYIHTEPAVFLEEKNCLQKYALWKKW